MTSPTNRPASKGFGLGRGLDALFSLSEAENTVAPGEGKEYGKELVEIPVLNIRPNPQQPRKDFSRDKMKALSESIRSSGLLQPLVVQRDRETLDRYLLISGERRWRASQLAGLLTVPAIIWEATSQESLVLALIENVQRADLSPLELAQAFLRLSTHHDLTHAQIAEAMGISRSSVTNAIRLLSLPNVVQEALASEKITVGHARAILSWPTPDDQSQALQKILTDDLTVRQTEEAFLDGLQPRAGHATHNSAEAEISTEPGLRDEIILIERQLRAQLGTKVNIQRRQNGAGRLVLHFYDDVSLNRLIETLLPDNEQL